MTAPNGIAAMQVRPGHPDFLDLPWDLPLARWPGRCSRIVEVQRGVSRHEVLFVQYDRAVCALKELPVELGEREYDALRWLEDHRLPAVVAAGHARVRTAAGEASVLLTRFLDGSLPYRTLFEHAGLETYRGRLIDAMAGLLVRLHLAGFYWGDCSLSNTLFRRDAGELQAYLVDAETSETHERLSDGQRHHDLEILEENVAGDLADVAGMLEVPQPEDLDRTGADVRARYDSLWGEITREEVLLADESWKIRERIRALNALGFTVGEVQELRATLERAENRSVPLSVAAYRWLAERYQPAARRLAPLVGTRGDADELYCQMLEHKWYLSERAKRDVGHEQAVEDFVRRLRAEGSAGQ